MSQSKMYEDGLKVRKEVLGEDYVSKSIAGALKNGLTKEEIKETVLQVAVYCGIPAGIDGFRNARDAFKELEDEFAK